VWGSNGSRVADRAVGLGVWRLRKVTAQEAEGHVKIIL
jgi:hypothetical protein